MRNFTKEELNNPKFKNIPKKGKLTKKYTIAKCTTCGDTFGNYTSVLKLQTTCSEECTLQAKALAKFEKFKCVCKMCGIEFLPKRPAEGGDICSYKCSGEYTAKWNINTIFYEALRYSTRSRFAEGSRGAYAAAISLDILDNVCKHMECNLPSDNNVIYIWCIPFTDVYKIGITSSRLGMRRLETVSKALGVEYGLTVYEEVDNASTIETLLFKRFSTLPNDIPNINGSTEFRVMNSTQVWLAKQMINKYKKENYENK